MAVQRAKGVLLGSWLLLLLLPKGIQACGHVAIESPVVHFGSLITASCIIRHESCSAIHEGIIRLLWTLDGHPIPDTQDGGTWGTQSNVTIERFERPKGILSCYVAQNVTHQLVDRVEIQAGYAPSKPKDLVCIMNVTEDSLTCTWDPGRETYIDTNFTLERFRNRGRCGHLQDKKEDCIPKKGQSSCTIPREFLNLYQKVDMWVTAKNALGRAESEHLCLDPMEVVKLDPPTIQRITSSRLNRGCLKLEWAKPVEGSWIQQWFELRYKAEEDITWQTVTNITSSALQMEHCGFRLAHKYHFQMRCIKKSLRGYWSEWSDTKHFLTPEGAPVGTLDVWWKSKRLDSERSMEVQLLWKAMRKEDARGTILGYLVFYTAGDTPEGETVVCNTTEEVCHFLLPIGLERVSVQAYNSAGLSPVTEVILLNMNGHPLSRVQAFPNDDHSLQVAWDAAEVSVTGYVLEWCRVAETSPCDIKWKKENNACNRALIQENIEPFVRYKILLYPLYKHAVGKPVQTEAYTREKAPSRTPKLEVKAIRKSHAELTWEPVPVEERNGFLTSYTVFWTDAKDKTFWSVLEASSRSFILGDLVASSTYKVYLTSSTSAGTTNGTVLTLHTTLFDEIEVGVLIMICMVTLCLLFFMYRKKQQMKNRFWPDVPDPANSTSGKWIPAELQEENKLPSDMREPQQVITCDVTILEKDAAQQKNRSKDHLEDPLKSFIHMHKEDILGSLPQFSDHKLRSYVNTSESVQYAKVIVDSYRGQCVPAPLYIRSDSTQPLLGDMTPSPKPYENLWFHGTHREENGCPVFQEDTSFHESESLMEFPLLQGLRIEGSDDLSDLPNFRALASNKN
ncbi:granulocyte colony-stimulating factor receptor [Pleurodeles waltl]